MISFEGKAVISCKVVRDTQVVGADSSLNNKKL